MKIGLVLEGGGMRGIYTAGILDAFMEHNIFKYPKFVKALQNRHMMYNDSLAKLKEMEREGNVLVIRPEASLDIGRLENNPEKIQKIYDIGYQDGTKNMTKIKEFIYTSSNP